MRYLFGLLPLFVGAVMFAQDGVFTRGYYISNEGDTIRGLLSKEPYEALAKEAYFKPAKDGELVKLFPHEVRQLVYEKYGEVHISIPHVFFQMKENNLDSEKKQERRFMQKVFNGKYALYRLQLSNKERFLSDRDR